MANNSNYNTSFMNKILNQNSNKNVNTRVSKSIQNSPSQNSSSSYLNNIQASLSGGATTIGIILITLFIVLIIYYVTKKYTVADKYNPILIPKPLEMGKLGDYGALLPLDGVLAIGEGRSLSYSVWVYVKDWSRSSDYGTIFSRLSPGSTPHNNSSMRIDYRTNELVVSTHSDGCGNNNNNKSHEFKVSNFPLQKWNHIIYVLNGSIIDLYLNGKLAKSVLFRSAQQSNSRGREREVCHLKDTDQDNIIIGKMGVAAKPDSYTGQISRFNYYSRPLSPTDVLELYGNGPF